MIRESANPPYFRTHCLTARNVSIQARTCTYRKTRTIAAKKDSGTVVATTSVEAVLTNGREETTMLWTIFVILLVLWLIGLVSSYTFGGFIHLLLVVAVIVLIINLVTGRSTV